jgi:energy-coupling factor transport system ATP-binding protein
MANSPVAPPVVELGRLAGWSPLPLSIRDARRRAGDLRERLLHVPSPAARMPLPAPGEEVLTTCDLGVRYGPVVALRDVSLSVRRGEVVALMGRNGAGKSTLLRALTGLATPAVGAVRVVGADPAALAPRQLVTRVGLVPQQAGDLLYADTVAAECAAADHDAGAPAGTARTLLDQLVPGLADDAHPRDLSEGQRLGLVLAIVLSGRPPVVLLDEPTRGLDYAAKRRLVVVLRQLAREGHAVVLATHDVELAAAVASRTVVLADGEVVVDGPTQQVVVGSPAFAPQVAKILAPSPWLTVDEVAAALAVAS